MHLELTEEEAALLYRILTAYVSDLRMEVAGTDKFSFRQDLKHEEAVLKKLLSTFPGREREA